MHGWKRAHHIAPQRPGAASTKHMRGRACMAILRGVRQGSAIYEAQEVTCARQPPEIRVWWRQPSYRHRHLSKGLLPAQRCLSRPTLQSIPRTSGPIKELHRPWTSSYKSQALYRPWQYARYFRHRWRNGPALREGRTGAGTKTVQNTTSQCFGANKCPDARFALATQTERHETGGKRSRLVPLGRNEVRLS